MLVNPDANGANDEETHHIDAADRYTVDMILAPKLRRVSIGTYLFEAMNRLVWQAVQSTGMGSNPKRDG